MIDPILAEPGSIFDLDALAFILDIAAAVVIKLRLIVDLRLVVLLGNLRL